MTKDMTTGNPAKIIMLFSIPVLLGNLFQQLYSMVDTAIVGQFVGINALAAVGCMILQSAVNTLGSIMVAGYTAASKVEALAMQPFKTLGITMATYTGQNLGAGKIDRIKKGTQMGMLICTACIVFYPISKYCYCLLPSPWCYLYLSQ